MRSADEIAEQMLEDMSLREVIKEFAENQLNPLSLYQRIEAIRDRATDFLNEVKPMNSWGRSGEAQN